MFVSQICPKKTGFSDMFYFSVHSLGAAKDPLNPLFQNLMTPEQLCVTNSIGLFRKRILVCFFFF